MILFRAVQEKDLNDIYQLSKKGGTGITTLPQNETILKKRIQSSLNAFAQDVKEPNNESYLFVIEDTSSGKVVGTSAIESAVGYDTPFYSYKVSTVTRICKPLDIRKAYQVLHLVNDYQGKTELCTLFLDPEYRKGGVGRFLSRARLLFLAQFPKRFADTIFAEMRGRLDDDGGSAFWRSLGKHFFDMEFKQADFLTAVTDKQFIADLMPRNAIYTNLLTKEAQQVIGKVFKRTKPAKKILEREGFMYKDYIDIFDAGPTLEASLPQIRTVRKSKLLTVKDITVNKVSDDKKYILSNTALDFRACFTEIKMDGNNVTLDQETASLLKLNIGDEVRAIEF